jgi:hypothetical protein
VKDKVPSSYAGVRAAHQQLEVPMGYSVYLHKFEAGEPAFVPFAEVAAILRRYGTVTLVGSHIEFTPKGDDLCEVGFIAGSESEGIDSIGFERPVFSDRLRKLIFELLSVRGMCYFEQDATFVLDKTDVKADLPEGLLDQCESGQVTLVRSFADVANNAL